jgi:hypothetical protein
VPALFSFCNRLLRELRLVELDGLLHRIERLLLAVDTFDLYWGWLTLECLVGLEEVLILLDAVFIEIREILYIFPALVVDRDGNDLVVTFTIINHIDDGDRACGDEDAWRKGIGGEEDDVEGVVVVPERLWHEAVVVGECGRRVIGTVELDEAGRLIDLVLVVGAFRDLNDDVDLIRSVFSNRNVVPQVHI